MTEQAAGTVGHPLKKDTFVLDFANSAEEIEKSFAPYFENTVLGEATDPNKLFDLQDGLDQVQVYTREQVTEFSDKILASAPVDELHAILDEAAAVFRRELAEELQIDFSWGANLTAPSLWKNSILSVGINEQKNLSVKVDGHL